MDCIGPNGKNAPYPSMGQDARDALHTVISTLAVQGWELHTIDTNQGIYWLRREVS